jgi:ABC-type ATPase involved in cell division
LTPVSCSATRGHGRADAVAGVAVGARLYEVRRLFGVLFQDGALLGSMSLYDNIAFPLREHTRKSEAEVRRVVMSFGGQQRYLGKDSWTWLLIGPLAG